MNTVEETLAAFQATWAGVMTVDHEGFILMINREAEHIGGVQALDAIGHRLCDVLPIGCDEGHVSCLWKRTVNGSERRQAPRELTQGRDRGTRLLVGARQDTIAGESPGAVITFIDLTQQRLHADDHVRAVDDTMHNLRSPLSAISLAAQFLSQDRADIAPERFTQLIDIIQRNAVALVETINQTLDHPERRSIDHTATEARQLYPIVRAAISTIQPLIDDKRQTVLIDVDEQILVTIDPKKLESVVVNLLSNATKYSVAEDTIVVRAVRLPGNRMRLDIEDHGPGIRESDRVRVFDRLVRLETGDGTDGNGLGLAIVRDIIGEFGGTVGVASVEPHGARFWLEV